MSLTFHDDSEIALRAILRSVSPSDYGTFTQSLMSNLGFGGTTSDPVFDHLADSAQPLVLYFHYHRLHDSSWGDNRITATLLPVNLPAFSSDKPPTSAIQLGSPRSETSTAEITLPAGWTVDLPAPVHAVTAFATCDVTFHLQAGKLVEVRKLVVLRKEVPVIESKAYLAWYDAAGISGTPFLQLFPPTKATADTGHTAPAAPSSAEAVTTREYDPKAAELVQQAGVKIRDLDPESARALLDQARKLNPSERGLWTGYAALAGEFGATSESVEDLRRELAFHPDEVRLYGYIAQEQQRSGDHVAALATARSWVGTVPTSPEANLALLGELAAAKRFAEVETASAAALVLLGKDASPTFVTTVLLLQANADVQLGKKDKAARVAEPLLKTATDPNQINDIAFLLADANVDLPEAEAAQRTALASLDAAAATQSLTDAPSLVDDRLRRLAAAWDTMGWILFREGHPAEALPYIQAAARSMDHQEIRDHLSALATTLHRPSLGRNSEQQLRTLPLGSASGRHGTAELRFLLVDGKVTETGPPSSPGTNINHSDSPHIPDAAALLESADLHSLVPPGSHAHLVRAGILNCSGNVCQLVLLPLGPG